MKTGNNRNMLLIGVIVVAAVLLLAPRLFGNRNADTTDTRTDDNNPTTAQTVDDGIDLGNAVVADQVDRDGCPVTTVSNLSNVNTFYVVAPDSEVAEGTDIFVRLYQDGHPVEDLPMITANQNYASTCISFVFETNDGFAFEAGDYEAEFWVNGNSYDSVSFEIR